MTDNERDAEIGRTVREYKEQGEKLGCLRSRLGRTADAIAEVIKAMDEKKDSKLFSTVASNALKMTGDTNVSETIADMSDAWSKREALQKRIQEQGFGGVVQ